MKKEKFPISRIGLGTAQFGQDYGYSKKLGQNEVNAILNAAFEAGITFLDTAREYGDSESKIGAYMRESKRTFVVGTKLARIDEETSKDEAKIRFLLSDSIIRSKEALNTNLIQLLLLHQTEDYIVKNDKFWSALKGLKKLMPNFAIKFGVSVYDPGPTMEMISKHGEDIDCVQAPYNVADRRFEALAGLFQENAIVFVSRSTFLKGALVEAGLPEELRGLEPVRNKLKELSKISGLSASQLLTHFVLDAGFIDCTLTGVRSVEQLRKNLELNRSREGFLKVKEELSKLELRDSFLIDPRQWKAL